MREQATVFMVLWLAGTAAASNVTPPVAGRRPAHKTQSSVKIQGGHLTRPTPTTTTTRQRFHSVFFCTFLCTVVENVVGYIVFMEMYVCKGRYKLRAPKSKKS